LPIASVAVEAGQVVLRAGGALGASPVPPSAEAAALATAEPVVVR
jgi:hypothetical protein